MRRRSRCHLGCVTVLVATNVAARAQFEGPGPEPKAGLPGPQKRFRMFGSDVPNVDSPLIGATSVRSP